MKPLSYKYVCIIFCNTLIRCFNTIVLLFLKNIIIFYFLYLKIIILQIVYDAIENNYFYLFNEP